MGAFFSKFKIFGIVLLIISAVIITLFYNALKPEVKLPIYQPADFNTELVDSTLLHKKKYHTVANFKLTNQNGETITQDNYANKIYVADFFFTTCQTICPTMTKNMAKIQEVIKDDEDVMLLSHSVTPEIDSVAQLKKYAVNKGVIDSKWNLVTGDRKEIYDLARKSYMAAKTDLNNPYSMVHTENFVLVDKEKRIRGTYDGTNAKEIKELLEDIRILKASYKE
ncbi:SCO family protein [Cellulophaga omnivescoria]|uniref:SCO family protein n=1 Tax=Cellulophaga omnivescoria TaxID=1888890 RepID=UPI000984CD5F|nr:SCO family protein [Cellulophaga omnivescoria]WBU90958.1 SCO family protein [Cellulophaga omnivescoria]